MGWKIQSESKQFKFDSDLKKNIHKSNPVIVSNAKVPVKQIESKPPMHINTTPRSKSSTNNNNATLKSDSKNADESDLLFGNISSPYDKLREYLNKSKTVNQSNENQQIIKDRLETRVKKIEETINKQSGAPNINAENKIDWIEYFDHNTNRKYYFSPTLNKSVWEIPEN